MSDYLTPVPLSENANSAPGVPLAPSEPLLSASLMSEPLLSEPSDALAYPAAMPSCDGERIGPLPDPLTALAEAILLGVEGRIPGGVAHARLVSEAAAAVGVELGLSEDHCLLLSCAGLLHDIGCVEWPAQLLSKPGRWSNDDVTRAQRHPVSGASMLSDIPDLKETGLWIRQHHERSDGTGYPDSLFGSLLSEEGRLLAVIEVFAACVTLRPFRGPLSPAETVARLKGEVVAARAASAPDVLSVSTVVSLPPPRRRAQQTATGLDPACVEVLLSALQRAVPGRTLEKQTAWPSGGLAFDSPMLRRALSETFRAIADHLAEDYEARSGGDAGRELRRALNQRFAAHALPIRFTVSRLEIDRADSMTAIEIAALARRAMLVQAEHMDALLRQPRAAQLRDTTYSCLTPWGQELAERYELFDGMALSYSGSQSTLFDGLSAYSPEAIAPGEGDTSPAEAGPDDAGDGQRR